MERFAHRQQGFDGIKDLRYIRDGAVVHPIAHNHPNLKGSFTCLGIRFNCLNARSMKACYEMLETCTLADKKTGLLEAREALKATKTWEPDPTLDFLYKRYAEENGTELYEIFRSEEDFEDEKG